MGETTLFRRVMAVLTSCTTETQLSVAIKYKNNYLKYCDPPKVYAEAVSKVARTLTKELSYII